MEGEGRLVFALAVVSVIVWAKVVFRDKAGGRG
jgi:hypothetical protein